LEQESSPGPSCEEAVVIESILLARPGRFVMVVREPGFRV
jgi:hypothetical protein